MSKDKYDRLESNITEELSEDIEEPEESDTVSTNTDIWRGFDLNELDYNSEENLFIYLLNRCDEVVEEQERRIERTRRNTQYLSITTFIMLLLYSVLSFVISIYNTIISTTSAIASILVIIGMGVVLFLLIGKSILDGEKEEDLANYHPEDNPENQTAKDILTKSGQFHNEYILKLRAVEMEENYQYLSSKMATVRFLYIYLIVIVLSTPLSIFLVEFFMTN